jgi:hypothetical protein
VEPDEVDWYCDQFEEEYWQYCQDKKEALMGATIEGMAQRMLDETLVTKDLDNIRTGIFKDQLVDSFEHTGGPEYYWHMVEQGWYDLTEGEPIPTKYRTNKSVILKAWRVSNNLDTWVETKPTGELAYMGKSAVQAKCMVMSNTPKTPENVARAVIDALDRYKKSASDEDWATCMTIIDVWTGHAEDNWTEMD